MQLFTLAGFIFSLAALTVAAPNSERAGPCTEARQQAGRPMPGKYIPQCTIDGYFETMQCHGSTGYCWCVDSKTGKEIEGTRGHGRGPVQCSSNILSLAAFTVESAGPCTEAKRRAGKPMPGKFIPQCTNDGYYQPLQCHSSTGYCWCVNAKTGEEVEGTRVGRGQGHPQCSSNILSFAAASLERSGPCAEARQRAGTEMPGKYVPQCSDDGYYQPTQCHGSTGYCWCVDPKTGKELEGTRVGPGRGHPQCSSNIVSFAAVTVAAGPCAEARQRAGTEMPGKYVPQCTNDGYYQPTQCHGSTGYCWCVDPKTGKELEGTRVGPGRGHPQCASNVVSFAAVNVAVQNLAGAGPCSQAKQHAGTEMPGKYVPQCTNAGYYQPIQCHASTGYCWCVNPDTGKELEGTRVAPGGGQPPCPTCHKQRALALQPPGFVGGYAPVCDEYGLFVPTQHHASTGSSWCVDHFTGEKFQDQDPTTCTGSRYCRKNETEGRPCCAMYFQESGTVFRLECTRNGYFQTLQTIPYINVQFCVNPENGLAARETIAPNCGACFKNIEEKVGGKMLLGATLPQCDKDTGDYQALQKSHDLYRWCVDPHTGAVQSEKRRFDDKTPLPCEH